MVSIVIQFRSFIYTFLIIYTHLHVQTSNYKALFKFSNARALEHIILYSSIFSFHHGFWNKKKVQKHAYWKVNNGYTPSLEILYKFKARDGSVRIIKI